MSIRMGMTLRMSQECVCVFVCVWFGCVVQLISFYLQILCHKYHKNCNSHSQQRNEVDTDADWLNATPPASSSGNGKVVATAEALHTRLQLLFFWGQALEHDSSLVCQASHAKLLQNKWHMRALKLQMPTAAAANSSSNCNCQQQPETAAVAAAAALMIRLSSQSCYLAWHTQMRLTCSVDAAAAICGVCVMRELFYILHNKQQQQQQLATSNLPVICA